MAIASHPRYLLATRRSGPVAIDALVMHMHTSDKAHEVIDELWMEVLAALRTRPHQHVPLVAFADANGQLAEELLPFLGSKAHGKEGRSTWWLKKMLSEFRLAAPQSFKECHRGTQDTT